ncbi:MAG: 4'-phosphopantetheinyl transferase superfamily protein [Rhodospirillales bacterium]|nr:4'-phosphopantetheinyl transferase superfamily protein [Rhodospirillales bacterium]
MTKTTSPWWSPWREVDGATILHVDLTPDAELEVRALSLLDDEERTRWRRFLSERARRDFAYCRAALRASLCERLGCENRALSFGYGEHGKPFATVDGQCARIGFNVSHSGRHGLIAIAAQDCLGVDVEERVARRDLEGIGSLVYGPAERRLLTTAEGREKVHLFYRLWSMKEALIKAIGAGFSLSPSRFEVPQPMLHGAKTGEFRFPHAPSAAWRLHDLGEQRFAVALAYRLLSQSSGS